MLCLWLAVVTPGLAETLTQGERDRAMSELHATRKQFLDSLTGLSEAQWNFKPGEATWSIAECAEHIIVTEGSLMQLLKKMMASPATQEKAADTEGKDALVLKRLTDRSRKAQAPEFLRPTGRWRSPQAAIEEFKQRRDATIEYVKTTQEDLRSHSFPHPSLGALDGYQTILLMAGHSQRHIDQLNELKHHPNFPKP
jgi:uncharacterized damage-inducible protein DinB